MSIVVNPTAFQNPDAGQGGNAMSSPSVTGHASSTATGSGSNSETKSCRWLSFTVPGGIITGITLKVTHTSSGTLTGPTPGNEFAIEYSLNNGSSWITLTSRSNFTASSGPTVASVTLPPSQNISQVQVRDHVRGVSVDPADTATATATLTGISLEVDIVSNPPIWMG